MQHKCEILMVTVFSVALSNLLLLIQVKRLLAQFLPVNVLSLSRSLLSSELIGEVGCAKALINKDCESWHGHCYRLVECYLV
jgi:hypothetical protein